MGTLITKQYTGLGKRQDFNLILRHLVNVTMMVEEVVKGKNLAEILSDGLDNQSINRGQVNPILSIVLGEKLQLPVKSHNMLETVTDFSKLLEYYSKWNGVDLVLAYHHPNLGVIVANPANEEHWDSFPDLKKDELIVVYARSKKDDRPLAQKALDNFFKILKGETPEEDPGFVIQVPAPKVPEVQATPVPAPAATPAPQAAAPAQQPAAPAAAPAAPAKSKKGGKRNLSPRYSVQVTNELFHNGNVEAWKNIIEAYEAVTKNKVIVFHEGELIQDLNSLFKWGKVKHGGVIHFQVMGDEIKMVSRLQKYLYEGASSRFESFLKKDVTKVLNIF